MSSINLKFLIAAVVTISILLIAGSLLISTLNPVKNPVKTPPQPSPSPASAPAVNTSQPTSVQPALLPVEAVRADQATGSGQPFYGERGGGPAGGQSASQ